MDGERINLTVSGPVAQAVGELAQLLGLSKSATVAGYLTWNLPELRVHIERLRASGLSCVDSGPSAGSGGRRAPQASGAASGRGKPVSAGNRAERRRLQREDRKSERSVRVTQ